MDGAARFDYDPAARSMRWISRAFAGPDAPERWDLLFLALFFTPSFFLFLGRTPLVEPDEGRYAEIPREMLERGDFLTPRLNHVKYFEKPPLLYWLVSASFSVLGQNELAARFPSALAGLLGVLWTYHVGRKVFGRREALFSALVLGTCIGYQAHARINIIDPLLTACLSGALGSFLVASREGEARSRTYYLLFFLFAALAVVAKGLVGVVLPAGIAGAYLLLTRRWKLLREMHPLAGSLLFLLVSAPWFILVGWKNPEFYRFFFIHEHWDRFLSDDHNRSEPLWYYLPVFLMLFLPWSLFLPAAAVRSRKRPELADARLFLWIWAVLILTFFSLSQSKLIPYILPVVPAAALLLGSAFPDLFASRAARLWAPVVCVFCAVAAGVVFGLHRAQIAPLQSAGGAVVAGCLLACGVLGLLGFYRGGARGLFAAFCLSWWALEALGTPEVIDKWAERKTSKQLALRAEEEARLGSRIATYRGYEQGLAFYTKRRILVVGRRGELEFGSNQGDQSAWFLEEAEFSSLWDSRTPLVALVDWTDLARFRSSVKVPPRVLGHWKEKVLITNG